MAPPGVAFVAAGGLFVRGTDGVVRELTSRFAADYIARASAIQKKHAWKSQGRGARFMAGGMLWGGDEAARIRIAIKGLARGTRPGEVLYALDTDGLSGLFARELATPDERRLYHSADHMFHHLATRDGSTEVALTVSRKNGTSAIALFDENQTKVRELTEGDTLDLAPSWCPGAARALVYQSAGVGRDAAGEWAGLAPFSIQRLDLDRETMEPLLEDPAFDYLNPRVTPQGDVLAIRRPHGTAEPSLARALWETLAIPFRLGHAIFQYLNFFTAMYTGKPLTSAGLPRRPGAELKHLMIWGNVVDAEEAAREARRSGDPHPALVPKSWELVRRAADGTVTSLAQGVLSFDLADDGAVVYANGSAVFRIGADGQRELVVAHDHVEQVIALR